MKLSIVEEEQGLVRYETAKRAIAAAVSVDEVKDWHDKAAAIRAYARQVNDRQMELDAAEIRIRAERRLGEMLKEQKETVGLNTGGWHGNQHTGPVEDNDTPSTPPLHEVGISRDLSSRSQAIAAIPEQDFESTLTEHRESQKAVTQSTMEKLAKQGNNAKTEEERQREMSGRPEWMSVEDFRIGIKAHGWIRTLIRETKEFDPDYVVKNCLPDKIKPSVITNTRTAIRWLNRLLDSLEGKNV